MAAILEQQRMEQTRAMAITVFGAYILFVVAGLVFYGIVDDSPFVPLMQTYVALRLAWFTVEGGALVALLAFLAGGIPIGLALLKGAVSAKRRDLLLLLGLPLVVLTCALAVRVMLLLLVPGRPSAATGIAALLFSATNVIFLIALIASPFMVVLAVIRSDVNAQLFHVARLPTTVVTLAMVGMALATIGWGCIAYAYAPQNFNAAGVFALSAGGAWGIVVAVMLLTTSVAVIATLRNRSHHSSV